MKHLLPALVLSLASSLALADYSVPFMNCSKPIKPHQFNSQMEVDFYRQSVANYRDCVQQFIKEQREMAARHMEAAKQAVEAWNSFAQYGH